MNAVIVALQEVYGLFVEDGTLAVGILIWLAVSAFVFTRLPEHRAWGLIALFVGLLVLLAENVWRGSRRR